MELYTLDENFRRMEVIDRFESLIWTERFNDLGDFQLTLASSSAMRGLLSNGTALAMNRSNRVMTIENTEDKFTDDGKHLITVTGRSFESFLIDRPPLSFRPDISNHTSHRRNWYVGDFPQVIIQDLFDGSCVEGIFPEDLLPNYQSGSFYPEDTIPFPDTTIYFEIEFWRDVFTNMKAISEEFNLGLRLIRNPLNDKLYFNVYAGSNRTSSQDELPAVIFSPDLENLVNLSELSSEENYKNVAYVGKVDGDSNVAGLPFQTIVYADGIDPDAAGFQKRILWVSDANLDPNTENNRIQLGKTELAKHRQSLIIDGELGKRNDYRYEVDYFLGDLIELRNEEGVTNMMRVTEQIFTDDSEGEKEYPTLVLDALITPGSWGDWIYNRTWEVAEGTWSEQ